jgi:hypothetical protein
MTAVAEARERWAAETAVTADLAERAREELQARGLEPGQEDDRVSAEEWLALHRETVEAEDEVRPVTEHDVPVEQLDVEPEAVDDEPKPEPEPEAEVELEEPEPEPEPSTGARREAARGRSTRTSTTSHRQQTEDHRVAGP